MLRQDVPEDPEVVEQEVIEVPEESYNEEEDDIEEVLPANQAASQQADAERRVLRNRAEIRPLLRYEVDCAEYVAPSTFEEAMDSRDAAKWTRAVREELQAHERNHTWSIVPRISSQKIIDSKWVFRVKEDPENKSMRFKARLCARGFMQREGIDFTETFALVVRYDFLRTVLAMVAERDLLQFDVQTAFLYGELNEDIFMEIPEGLEIENEEKINSVVCKLQKSLYGLKQTPWCWNLKFKEFLSKYEFEASEGDQCVFIRKFKGVSVYLALFVDDGLVVARSRKILETILSELSKAFDITIGDASVFVDLQIKRDRNTKSLLIYQAAYTSKIIERFKMVNSKVIITPADSHSVLLPAEKDRDNLTRMPYREAVGSLMFLAMVSRPDIAFAVNAVSRFSSNHDSSHWRAVKRIIAYLAGTVEY